MKDNIKNLITSGSFLIWGILTGRMLPTWEDINGGIAYGIFFIIGVITLWILFKKDTKQIEEEEGK